MIAWVIFGQIVAIVAGGLAVLYALAALVSAAVAWRDGRRARVAELEGELAHAESQRDGWRNRSEQLERELAQRDQQGAGGRGSGR